MRYRLVLLMLAMIGLPAFGQAVYKWVDEKGVVNYGPRPPTKAKSTAVDTKAASAAAGDVTGGTTDELPARPVTARESKRTEERRLSELRRDREQREARAEAAEERRQDAIARSRQKEVESTEARMKRLKEECFAIHRTYSKCE